MKIGYRKPNIKKSIKARTTRKVKRKVKSTVNPFYGKKGMGYVKNPKKAVCNNIYHKTTVGTADVIKAASTPAKSSPIATVILLLLFFPLGLYFVWRRTDWRLNAKVIISLIFCVPFGLVMMWLYADWSKPIKTIITVVLIVVFFIAILNNSENTSATLNGVWNYAE